jgi:hypothetical protein
MMRTKITIPETSLNIQTFSSTWFPIQSSTHPQRYFKQSIGEIKTSLVADLIGPWRNEGLRTRFELQNPHSSPSPVTLAGTVTVLDWPGIVIREKLHDVLFRVLTHLTSVSIARPQACQPTDTWRRVTLTIRVPTGSPDGKGLQLMLLYYYYYAQMLLKSLFFS